MHIPDALLSHPVALATGAVAVAGLGLGLRRVERERRDRTMVLMGTMAAFVFAAQMVKFPVGPGVAGHLLGGVLAAVMLGPWAGAGVIAAVLIVQCLLFGDGGLTALGANFINMGLIGSIGGYAIYEPIRRSIGGRRGILIGAMVAAWLSVILASGAFALELGASNRGDGFFRVLGWMALVHAGIGVGEAIITGVVLRFLLIVRPDLIYEFDLVPVSGPRRWAGLGVAGLAVSLAVAVFLAPFATGLPDGLEFVGARLGFLNEAEPVFKAPMPGYKLEAISQAAAAAGLIGTLIVFGVGLGLARIFAKHAAQGIDPDVA